MTLSPASPLPCLLPLWCKWYYVRHRSTKRKGVEVNSSRESIRRSLGRPELKLSTPKFTSISLSISMQPSSSFRLPHGRVNPNSQMLMGKKDFTSFHHVKGTDLGEHTLNMLYHDLLRFIFRTVEILTIFGILSTTSVSQRGTWKFLQTGSWILLKEEIWKTSIFGSRAQHNLSIFIIDGILPDTTDQTPFPYLLTSTPYLQSME